MPYALQALAAVYGATLDLQSGTRVRTEAFAAAFEARINEVSAWNRTSVPTSGFLGRLMFCHDSS